ncbi:MAG: STAS domain-containing protein [Ornithinimicrobium sp.]|uniref:STAS domain-containing protein n=1 Tax=Ornithinimicrobium sp. TaxID=1977084 RepID=UPI001853A33E|nr:STAS domain-containing protein [Actinomycetota bacterium]
MTAAAGYLDVVVEAPGRELRLRGALNVRTVPNLRADLQRALEGGEGDLVLHLGEAEIHDATGLGVLVGAHHRALRRGRRLVIAEASDRLERLLRVTKLHLVLARTDSAPMSGPLRAMPVILPMRTPH